MPVGTYRYGAAHGLPGLRVGVTRHPPRGVRKGDYARRGYCDVWIPLLGPSAELLASYRQDALSFDELAVRYRKEMAAAAPRQAIELLAALARTQPVHLGCYCADETCCHRRILAELVTAAASRLPAPETSAGYASPACSMPPITDE